MTSTPFAPREVRTAGSSVSRQDSRSLPIGSGSGSGSGQRLVCGKVCARPAFASALRTAHPVLDSSAPADRSIRC